MKFKSEHMTQASGSIAGVTYARAKGGILYRRARAIPVNPQSPAQTQVRSALTSLVNSWITTLSTAQRTAWDTYGAEVLFTNKLGDPVPISGQNAYIGANVARMSADSKLGSTLGTITAAPTVFDRGDFTTPAVVSYAVATGLNMTFETGDAWVTEDAAAMLIFQGRPRNPSRKFFKGPWRLVGLIAGDSTTPPTSPHLIGTATLMIEGFSINIGQRFSTRVVVVRADGRWSSPRKLNDVTAIA